MKKHLFFLIALIFSNTIFGQKMDKNETNFTDPFQIDSTEYFLIPKTINQYQQTAYGQGKGSFPWGSYGNIVFYNAKTNQSKKLFGDKLVLIAPFQRKQYYYRDDDEKNKEIPANVLPNHIIYTAITENYSGDTALDADDPVYLYVSTKSGENLKQLTPNGIHVVSWIVSKDKKMILVKALNDKSGNKKFGKGDDYVLYRIDLHEDISQIKCYLIEI